jgi:hypothetical protein
MNFKKQKKMENINFIIDKEDLKCLFIACKLDVSFEKFVKDCEDGYSDYFKRNLENLEKYGKPKTFSQWVNGQIIALT